MPFSPIAQISLALAALLAAPSGPTFQPVTPAATPFRLGTFKLYALRDMAIVVPNDNSVFGVGQTRRAVTELLRDASAPGDHITLAADALLIEEPGRIVLIDTGLGPKMGGVLMQSLAKAGVSPDDVADILITHRHFDHTGGLLTADGGSAFPNAIIHLSQADWDGIKADKASVALVSAIEKQVKPFVPGAQVVPGITSVALPGHTPGHVGYQIASGRARLFDIGDTAHSSIVSLARPDWAMSFDSDRKEGEATREHLLKALAQSHERIFAPHFPYPGIGTIVAKGDGYAFKPGLK